MYKGSSKTKRGDTLQLVKGKPTLTVMRKKFKNEEKLKKKSLRHSEYYNTQKMYDKLYKDSINGNYFYKLYNLIISEENILRAYRTIKTNKGSTTKGTNGKTIKDIASLTNEEVISLVRNKLADYKPQSVRRVMIPKPNGKQRPLGIPNIEDRLIQQCIRQILDPICEAKFHKHSYGFRNNRSAHHALARVGHMINQSQIEYVIDIDIKGFFDNVNHAKLMKQMWNLGIRDKKVLCIIKKILTSEIDGEGIPTKGTPQGGIISPLLSNIVLNELDWWISSQWETFETKHKYSNESKKYRALKTTNLKEVWLVRYADDFKILCRDYKTAKKMYHATISWMKERLDLEHSEEKTKIVHLTKNYSDFLGFKIKARYKNNKLVWKTRLCDKATKNVQRKLTEQLKQIQKATKKQQFEVGRYNSMILGIQNYYKVAMHVNIDLNDIEYKLMKAFKNRLKDVRGKPIILKGKSTKQKNDIIQDKTYKKLYGKNDRKITKVGGRIVYPLGVVTTSPPMQFNQNICNYTVYGRSLIHENLRMNLSIVEKMVRNPNKKESIEYNDNRIGLYLAQYGKCAITKKYLSYEEIHIHHKKPRVLGGSDKYNNLVMLYYIVHKLVHATKISTITKLIGELNLNEEQINKVNELRIKAGNLVIENIA